MTSSGLPVARQREVERQRVLLVCDDAAATARWAAWLSAGEPAFEIELVPVNQAAARLADRSDAPAAALIDLTRRPADALTLVGDGVAHQVPLLLVTAGEPELDRAAMAAGAADCFDRGDLTPERLARLLRHAIQRAQVARRLREASAAAEATARAQNQLIAHVSHELRTPLNAIIGFSEMIRDGLLGPVGLAKYSEYAADIHASGTYLMSLITEILEATNLTGRQLILRDEGVVLADIADAVVRLMRPRAMALQVELVVGVPPGLPLLLADPRALRQILLNLMSNGLKFTPPGGRVAVTAAVVPEGGLDIRVIDTGIGLKAEDVRQLMESGNASDAAAGDGPRHPVGLGLALTRGLVELHGGSLALRSELGLGTTVTAHFPAGRLLRRTSLTSTGP